MPAYPALQAQTASLEAVHAETCVALWSHRLHCPQVVPPAPGWNTPNGHVAQVEEALAPRAFEYVPAVQDVQVDDAMAMEYVPAPHPSHTGLPRVAVMDPAGHGLQAYPVPA